VDVGASWDHGLLPGRHFNAKVLTPESSTFVAMFAFLQLDLGLRLCSLDI